MSIVSFHDLYLLGVITLVKAARLAPTTVRQSVVNGVALAAYWFSRKRRRQCEANLKAIFGDKLNEMQIGQIVYQSFREFWQDAFAWQPNAAERAALKEAELQGIRHLQQALGVGKGAILLETSFFGARGWSKQVLHHHGVLVHQVHTERHLGGFLSGPATRVQLNIIKPILDGWEKPFIADVIELPPSGSLAYTRQLMSILKCNEVVCTSGEGQAGQKYLNLPFLGQQRAFTSGIVNMAKLTGAPLLPIFCLREPGGKTRLIIEPPLSLQTATDRESRIENGMAQYAALLESYVRAYPGYYRFWHFRVNL